MSPTSIGTAVVTLAIVVVVSRLDVARYIHGFAGALPLRRTLRLAPYGIPVALGFSTPQAGSLIAVAVGIVLGAGVLAPHWRTVRSQLDPAFISMLPRLSAGQAAAEIYSLVGISIGQEYLYRWVILTTALAAVGVGSVVVSTALFVIVHPLQRYSRYSRKELWTIAVLGLFASILVLWSGGIAGAIALHATANAPAMLQMVARTREQPQSWQGSETMAT
jgi:membrane protease YdiL (CAAX protease family)